jgi:hypothetical protein
MLLTDDYCTFMDSSIRPSITSFPTTYGSGFQALKNVTLGIPTNSSPTCLHSEYGVFSTIIAKKPSYAVIYRQVYLVQYISWRS